MSYTRKNPDWRLWRQHWSLQGRVCVYCGKLADARDHVPSIGYYRRGVGDFLIVRSCKSCNAYLGTKPLHTVQERCDYIAKWRHEKPRQFKLVKPTGLRQEHIYLAALRGGYTPPVEP